jgi:hypothetical protein
MSAFGDFLLNMVAGTADQVIDLELESALQQLHDNNPVDYQAVIKLEIAAMAKLAPALAKSKSKFLAGIINAIEEAFKNSAEANGITL